MRRLDIGCAVYGKPEQLRKTVAAIQRHSVTDWRLFLVVNPHPRVDMREAVSALVDRDARIVPVWLDTNRGYSGAVNVALQRAETEYIAYVDDDATVENAGWDEALCSLLDRHHEVGMVFPNGGAYMIDRGGGDYHEVLWGVGFCWVLNRMCATDLKRDGKTDDGAVFGEVFDESLGHQDECDVALRVRMAGWKCGAIPSVIVRHNATSTNDPASVERINRGVVNFVNKWTRYFGGKNLTYHSPNVLRWHDWPPNALYLEEFFQMHLPKDLNASPEVVTINGESFDLLRVPRKSGFYTNRII